LEADGVAAWYFQAVGLDKAALRPCGMTPVGVIRSGVIRSYSGPEPPMVSGLR
jgi:hypothetical protein